MLLKGEIKVFQLVSEVVLVVLFVNRRQSGMAESDFPFKALINEECLANTLATIDSDKLSLTAFIHLIQLPNLLLTTNDIIHKNMLLFFCKVIRNISS